MDLPPEILSMIYGLMSKETLKCARMACKPMEQAAIPFLFDEVFMSSTYFDIEVANHITAHFAQHIKTITLSFRYYPEYNTSDFTISRHHEKSGWSGKGFADHEKHALSTYYKARDDHVEIIESGQLLAQLCQMLVRLPALRKLALTDKGCGFRYQNDSVYFYDLWKRGDLCPLEFCTLSKADHTRFHIGPSPGYDENPNPWHLIMSALSIADSPITEIVSMATETNCLIPMGSFVMTPRQAQDVAMRFKVLTKLRLSLRNEDPYLNQGDYYYMHDKSVSRALSAAVNLKNLSIEQNADIRESSGTSLFGSIIFEDCRFPKLRSLVLVNINVEEEQLLNFLGASPRLENLFFCRFALYAGSWASAAARMKSILQLKNVEITDISDELLFSPALRRPCIVNSDHRLIEDFFLRDGENPFTEQAIKDFYDNYDEEQRWEINKGIGDYEKHFETYH